MKIIQLQKLHLKNFCNISEADIDFNHNIVLLSGSSASGKSSVFDAISLLITSYKRADKYSDYIKQGNDHFLIELDAIIRNVQCHFRMVQGKNQEFIFDYGNKQYKNSEATDFIKSLELDYFSNIIFSLQRSDDITKLSPSQRSEYLRKLLNFGFLDKISTVKDELAKFDTILKDTENKISIKKELISNNKNNIKSLKPIENTDDEILDLTIKLGKLNESVSKMEDIKERQAEADNRFMMINEDHNKLLEKKNLLTQKISTATSENKNYEFYIKKSKDLTEQVSEATDLLSTNDKVIEQKQEKIKLIKKSLEDIQLKERELTAILIETKRIKNLINEKKCPHCGQETEDYGETALKDYLDSKSLNDQELNDTYSDTKKELRKLNQKSEELNEFLQECKSVKESNLKVIATYKEELSRIPIDKISEKTEENKNIILKSVEEVEDIDQVMIVTKDEIQLIRDLKEKINLELNQMVSLIDQSVEINKVISNYNNLIKINEEITDDNNRINNEIKIYEEEIAEFQSSLIDINKQITLRNEVIRILEKDLPNYMVIKTCESLQNKMNEFIRSVFPDYNVRLNENKSGVNFYYSKDPTIKEWINSKMSSGAEKDLLTASFKYSLAKLYGINILILDEIDSQCDEESSKTIYKSLIDSEFDQLIIITHQKGTKYLLSDVCDDIAIYSASNGKFTKVMNFDE